MTVGTYTIPNLIQGVSQQVAEQRRPAQMEAEANCINSPKDGLLARNGFNVQAVYDLGGPTAAFHEIFRGDEHYLVVVAQTADSIRVFDVADDYNECTVNAITGGVSDLYLDTGSDLPRKAISFQTAGDHTFIANRTIAPAMTATVQTTRDEEALIFVKAGSYLQTYQVTIVHGGNKYVWAYKTPDNSAAANAAYIATSQIAATFFRAMTGGAAGIPTSGAADDGFGVGAMFVGDPGGTSGSTVTATITATSLGFVVELRGNVIRVSHPTDAFTIDAGDSVGNTFISAIKDKVRSIEDLPEVGFEGVRFAVSGAAKDTSTDYYVEFTADNVWQETTGAGTHLEFDEDTMPHALINTGPGTFTFGPLTWSNRVVGDETSDPPKYFIGESIHALFFHQERLGILTEGAYDLSKARNSFSYHRDTMQTVLATDPISSPVSGSRSISLLRKAVLIDESLYLWAQQGQYRVSGGADGFRPESVENKPSSAFEFSPDCQPVTSGPSVYFATDGDQWATVRNVVYSGGRAQQAIDITAHVPEYIPSGVHHMNISDTLGMLFVLEVSARNLWHYQYIIQGNEIVQSAWNQWQFPSLSNVGWVSEYRGNLNMAVVQTGGGGVTQLVLGHLPLKKTAVDPGGTYLTRLDFRIDETSCSLSGAGPTDINLPFDLPDATLANMRVVIRTTAGAFTRGQVLEVTGSPAVDAITVAEDLTGAEFYVGVRILSFSTLSDFYERNEKGEAKLDDGMTVLRLYVSYKDSYEFSAVVTPDVGATYQTDLMVSAAQSGILDVPVQARRSEHSIQLINSSHYPSSWQRIKVAFQSVDRMDADGGKQQPKPGASEEDLAALRNEVTAALRSLGQRVDNTTSRAAFERLSDTLESRVGEVSRKVTGAATQEQLATVRDNVTSAVQEQISGIHRQLAQVPTAGTLNQLRDGLLAQVQEQLGAIGRRLNEVAPSAAVLTLRDTLTADMDRLSRRIAAAPTKDALGALEREVRTALDQLGSRVSTVARQVDAVAAKQARPSGGTPNRR